MPVTTPSPAQPEIPALLPGLTELHAPAHWACIDFLSDLHLQQHDANWLALMQHVRTTPADAVVLLGDIFEVWPGDDVLLATAHVFERDSLAALRQAGTGKALYFMPGNRDFLAGSGFCQAAGLQLLHDPCRLTWAEQVPGILLSHGDALCLDDKPYMQFRTMARQPALQAALLHKPLAERVQLARQLRQQSSDRKHTLGVEGYADVDTPAALAWLAQQHCTTLLHGHTHKPGDYQLDAACHRLVLSDWALDATPPRGDVLRLHLHGDAPRWERIGPTSLRIDGKPEAP